MNQLLTQWAIRHNVSHVALNELVQMMTQDDIEPSVGIMLPGTEAWVQSQIRLEASSKGVKLMRNNVGACQDKSGRLIRYGLMNDSKQMNERIKSADLVGIRPVLITQELVGHTIGQFVSREVKEQGWTYSGTGREVAQMRWHEFITGLGGDSCFASDTGTL